MEKDSLKPKKDWISIDFFHWWNSKELQYHPHWSEVYYEVVLQISKKKIWISQIWGYQDLLQQGDIFSAFAAWIYADARRREWS